MRTLPDKILTFEFAGGHVDVDEAGYLRDPSDWSPDFAEAVAEKDGLELTELHWRVLTFMRNYLDEHGIAADARFAIKFLAQTLDLDKHDAKHKLFELFPQGYVKQPCKISGMLQPRAWSTG